MINDKLLKYEIANNGTTIAGVCLSIGMNKSTYHRKIRNNSFLLREVWAIAELLHLSSDKAMAIFFNGVGAQEIIRSAVREHAKTRPF